MTCVLSIYTYIYLAVIPHVSSWSLVLIILAHTVILSYRWAKSVNIDLQLISEHKGPSPLLLFHPTAKKWVKIEVVQKNRPHVELYFMPRRIVRLTRFLRIWPFSGSKSGVKVLKRPKKRNFYVFHLPIWPWRNISLVKNTHYWYSNTFSNILIFGIRIFSVEYFKNIRYSNTIFEYSDFSVFEYRVFEYL